MKPLFKNTMLHQVLLNHFEIADVVIYEAILNIMEVTPAHDAPDAIEAYWQLIGKAEADRFRESVQQPSTVVTGMTRIEAADAELAQLKFAEKEQQNNVLNDCISAKKEHMAKKREQLNRCVQKRVIAQEKTRSARFELEKASRSYIRVLGCGDMAVIAAAKESCLIARARLRACEALYSAAYDEIQEIVYAEETFVGVLNVG